MLINMQEIYYALYDRRAPDPKNTKAPDPKDLLLQKLLGMNPTNTQVQRLKNYRFVR